MDFTNRLKGKITQGLFECLLEDVHYRVVPLGIEEIVREVKAIPVDKYSNLGLSKTLRSLPDFFVSLPDLSENYLVEVKYRKAWNNEVQSKLGPKLFDQVKQWGPIFLVLFLGEPARENKTPASYLGVCKLIEKDSSLCIVKKKVVNDKSYDDLGPSVYEDEFIKWEDITWNSFSRFQCIFDKVSSRWDSSTLLKATQQLKLLSETDE